MTKFDVLYKLNRILNGLLNCDFEFQDARDLTLPEISSLWRTDDLALLLNTRSDTSTWPMYISSEEAKTYGFPILRHGSLQGLAVVRGWKSEHPQKFLLLGELLAMVLDHGLQLEERREHLRLIEERLILMDESSNVIPLRPARFASVMQLTEHQIFEPILSESDLPDTMTTNTSFESLPILIKTTDGLPLHRIAVEIHQLSGRWAMVNLNDLPLDVLNSREQLKELGSITLFIQDLAALSTESQLRLAEYLSIKPSEDMPQIIAGVRAEVIDSGQLPPAVAPHLLKMFCLSDLQWTENNADEVSSQTVRASVRHLLDRASNLSMVQKALVPFRIHTMDNNRDGQQDMGTGEPQPPTVH